MGGRIAGVKFDGTLEFSLRSRPVPVECKLAPGKGGVRLGELVIYFYCLCRGRFRSWDSLRLREGAVQPKQIVGISQTGVWQGVGRVLFYCLLEVLNPFLQPLLCSLVSVVATFKIELVTRG